VAGGSVGSKMEMKVAERLAYWGSMLEIMLLCFVQEKRCTIKNNNAEY